MIDITFRLKKRNKWSIKRDIVYKYDIKDRKLSQNKLYDCIINRRDMAKIAKCYGAEDLMILSIKEI